MVLTHSHDEVEDSHERPDSVWVSSEHDIAEADIVVGCNMAGCDTGKWGLQKGDHDAERINNIEQLTFWLSSTLSITLSARVKSPSRTCTLSSPIMEK